MGLFFNNTKKIMEANETSKQNLITAIASVTAVCNQPQVLAALNDIRTELQSQGQSDSKEVVKLDAQMTLYLNELNALLAKQQYSSAMSKVTKMREVASTRRGLCMLGGTKTKADLRAEKAMQKEQARILKGAKLDEKTRLEELQEQQNQVQDELNNMLRQFEELKARAQKNPNDLSLQTQGQVTMQKIRVLQNRRANLAAEIQRESVVSSTVEEANMQKDIISNRTISDEQFTQSLEDMKGFNDMRSESMNTVNEAMNVFNSTGDVFSSNVFATDPLAQVDTNDIFGLNTNKAQTNQQAQQTQFGSFDASQMGSREMAMDIQKSVNELEKAIEDFNEKIEDKNDEMKEIEAELLPLLKKRETASASECLVLDGQIDQLASRHTVVKQAIKKYRNVVAQLHERLSLISQLDVHQDLAATKSRISSITSGRFDDLGGLAEFISSDISKMNEDLDEVGMAGILANGTDISMNTLSSQSFADGNAEVKDEGKYDSLLSEITAANKKQTMTM